MNPAYINLQSNLIDNSHVRADSATIHGKLYFSRSSEVDVAMRLLQCNSAGQFSPTEDMNGDDIPK
jgi:hypothetical protein